MVQLKDDERIDDLLAKEERRIIQSPSAFAFSLDAVLLADFTYVPKTRGKILDLCTGNGVIPLFLSTRSSVPITGVEIQERLHDMAVRNVELNELGDQLQMIRGDLKEMPAYYGNNKFDLVTCNPPYFPTPKTEEHNLNEYLAVARHEIHCTLEDVVSACSRLAKSGGKVSMVHRPDRLVEIIQRFKAHKLEPKRMRLVYPKAGKEANILLIEGVRDGRPGLKILPPLYALQEDGDYTDELKEILNGR